MSLCDHPVMLPLTLVERTVSDPIAMTKRVSLPPKFLYMPIRLGRGGAVAKCTFVGAGLRRTSHLLRGLSGSCR